MKKLIVILIAVVSMFIISGCGQDVKVTVYNASGVSAASGWIALIAHTERIDRSLYASTYAQEIADIDDTNGFVLTVKENDTLTVSANGEYAETDGSGAITMQPFNTVDNGIITETIYGGFPDAPEWYAACYINTIIIFKK